MGNINGIFSIEGYMEFRGLYGIRDKLANISIDDEGASGLGLLLLPFLYA